MEFWNSDLTTQSWNAMQDLKTRGIPFIVIGGWAAYLWSRMHKSKDLDIVLRQVSDISILRDKFNLKKNDHLKKYEVKIGDIDIDIYLPFYSRLAIPTEDISHYVSYVDGFCVVVPELLLILKQGAELDRSHSVKGQKDRIDIVTLLCFAPIDAKLYFRMIKKYKLPYEKRLKEIIISFQDVKHLDMTVHDYAKKKKTLLEKYR